MQPILCLCLALAATPFPPGSPVPAGEHPCLTVTRAELVDCQQRAKDDPVLRRKLDGLVRSAVSSLGQPFDGLPPFAAQDNSKLIRRAINLGYGALLTGRRDFADAAARILLAYADVYTTREPKPEGRVMTYSLQEAIWVCDLAVAADLALATGIFTPAQRQHLVDDLLQPAAITVRTDFRSQPDAPHKDGHHQCYNFQAWHCAAVGTIGFLLDDQDLIHWAIDGDYGFKHMVAHDLRDDGLFWERSLGYHSFVLSASTKLCEAAARHGVDLWNLTVPDNVLEDEWGSGNYVVDGDHGPKSYWRMLEAPRDYVFPDLTGAGFGDSSTFGLSSFTAQLELACLRTGQPSLVRTLAELAQRQPPAPSGWRTWAPEGQPQFQAVYADERCVLRIENAKDTDRGCWVSPVVGLLPPREVTVKLRYRTVGVTAAEGLKIRVVPYAGAKPFGDSFYTFGLPPSETWREATKQLAMPPEADQIGLEPFLWHAAGTVEMTDYAIASGDDLLLDPRAFAAPPTSRTIAGELPWLLPTELPEVSAATPDATFGTDGLRQNWCSLFPSSGFAVLRESWDDPSAFALVLSYGPYGGGHGHPDMLSCAWYGDGRVLVPTLGTVSYDSPLHGTWSNQTVAHNTVVVDQTSQWPRSKWGHDTAERQVRGTLRAFSAEPDLKLVRASCDNASDGVTLDRTLALLDGLIVDLYRVTDDEGRAHTYDYVLYGPAPFALSDGELQPTEPLGDHDGYEMLADLRSATLDVPVQGTFGDLLRLTVAAAPTTVVALSGVKSDAKSRVPGVMLRRRAAETLYAVVAQREGDERPVVVAATPTAARLSVDGDLWEFDLESLDRTIVRHGTEVRELSAPPAP